MLNEIARVFSSQGVLVPSTDYVAVPGQDGPELQPAQAGPDFTEIFNQAATRLELSSQAVKELEKSRGAKDPTEKPPEEKDQIKRLEKRDQEVRRHEQAHLSAAGQHARGGAKYEFQTGPDGKNYAIGGHVDIDVSPVSGNPEATLQKAQQVQKAALDPADPSPQDRAVAAAASQMAGDARKTISDKKQNPGEGQTASSNGGTGANSAFRAYAGGSSSRGSIVNVFG